MGCKIVRPKGIICLQMRQIEVKDSFSDNSTVMNPKFNKFKTMHTHRSNYFSKYKQFNTKQTSFFSAEYSLFKPVVAGNSSLDFLVYSTTSGKIKRLKTVKKTKNEIKIIKDLSASLSEKQPYLLKIEEVFEDSAMFYCVTENVNEMNLFQYFKQVKKGVVQAGEVRKLAYQLLELVQEFSNRGLVLGKSLLMSNICVDYDKNKEEAKIKMFHFSSEQEDNVLKKALNQKYPLIYYSPEAINSDLDTVESDVWYVGVVLLALLKEKYPFEKVSFAKMLISIRESKFDWSIERDPIAETLVKGMLDADPRRRLTVSDCLTHAWFGAPLSYEVDCRQWIERYTLLEYFLLSCSYQQYALFLKELREFMQILKANNPKPTEIYSSLASKIGCIFTDFFFSNKTVSNDTEDTVLQEASKPLEALKKRRNVSGEDISQDYIFEELDKESGRLSSSIYSE